MEPLPRSCDAIAWVTWRQAGVPAEGRYGMEGAGWLAGGAPRRYTVRRGRGRRQVAHLSLFATALLRGGWSWRVGDRANGSISERLASR